MIIKNVDNNDNSMKFLMLWYVIHLVHEIRCRNWIIEKSGKVISYYRVLLERFVYIFLSGVCDHRMRSESITGSNEKGYKAPQKEIYLTFVWRY